MLHAAIAPRFLRHAVMLILFVVDLFHPVDNLTQPTRELRDLTRYRVSLVQEINRIANRIQKVLEDANIKLASVATDALGASGRAILEAMLAGEQDAARLAEMSKGLLRNKIPELKLALEGRMKRKEDYRELGADHFDRIDVNRIRRS